MKINKTLVTAIINFKGGVAKTTTTMDLSAKLRKRRGRILTIDTEPQGNIIIPTKAK